MVERGDARILEPMLTKLGLTPGLKQMIRWSGSSVLEAITDHEQKRCYGKLIFALQVLLCLFSLPL